MACARHFMAWHPNSGDTFNDAIQVMQSHPPNSLPCVTDAEGDGANGEKGEVLSKRFWTSPKTANDE